MRNLPAARGQSFLGGRDFILSANGALVATVMLIVILSEVSVQVNSSVFMLEVELIPTHELLASLLVRASQNPIVALVTVSIISIAGHLLSPTEGSLEAVSSVEVFHGVGVLKSDSFSAFDRTSRCPAGLTMAFFNLEHRIVAVSATYASDDLLLATVGLVHVDSSDIRIQIQAGLYVLDPEC